MPLSYKPIFLSLCFLRALGVAMLISSSCWVSLKRTLERLPEFESEAGCSLAGWPGASYLTSLGSSVKWGLLHHGTFLIGSLQAGILKHLVQAFSKHWHEASPSFILLCGLLSYILHSTSPALIMNIKFLPTLCYLLILIHTSSTGLLESGENRVVSHAHI